jgi:hypothetical protein
MTRWTDTTAARILAGILYTPRHRAPRPAAPLPVDVTRLEDDYAADFDRAMFDRLPCLATPPAVRSVDEAQELAAQISYDRMAVVEVSS